MSVLILLVRISTAFKRGIELYWVPKLYAPFHEIQKETSTQMYTPF